MSVFERMGDGGDLGWKRDESRYINKTHEVSNESSHSNKGMAQALIVKASIKGFVCTTSIVQRHDRTKKIRKNTEPLFLDSCWTATNCARHDYSVMDRREETKASI